MSDRRSRDRRRFDIEPLESLMADLSEYLNSVPDRGHEQTTELWFAHILYNLADKLVDMQAAQREMVALLQQLSSEVIARDAGERGRKRRG